MPGTNDKYSNLIQLTVEESAANTLTFEEVNMGLTIFQKVGIIVNRVEIERGRALIEAIGAAGDANIIALTQSNTITSLSLNTPAVVFKNELIGRVSGTPATFLFEMDPCFIDYTNMPGGGLLMTPKPLYIGIQSNSLSATFGVVVRIYFQILELKADEYFELLEARRFFG